MEGSDEKYLIAIDTIIRTLLKSERGPIKKLKKDLIARENYGIDGRLAVYDDLLEAIVDILEDAGYLTKDFVIEASMVELEPMEG